MKVGAENRNKVIAAAALGALALVLIVRSLLGGGSPSSPSSAAAAPSAAQTTAPSAALRSRPSGTKAKAIAIKKSETTVNSLDPTLRFDLLAASEATKYSGNGRNIFEAQQIVIPTPVQPAVIDPGPPQPPPPPPPPPINLKFIGFASKPGDPKRIFLMEGEDIFVAKENDIIDRRYRVLRISPMAVEIEDVLNNNRQSIPLTQG